MSSIVLLISLGFMIGCISSALISDRRGRHHEAPKGSLNRRAFIGDASEQRLLQGPNIVCIGGGTGLSTLLRGLKHFTRNITAVVAVTDEGGSSGRLRQEWGVLPPGDIRNCLVALAEDDSSLNRILNFRFDRGELAGHSLGNLMLLAASELTGDFSRAVDEMNRLLAIRGRVLPATAETVLLCGETIDGSQVRGELDISDNGRMMKRLWLEPDTARPLSDVLAAIPRADIIVMGPGSLFTSVLPNMLIREIASAIKQAPAPKVYVANLMTQKNETEGMSITAHIDWIASILGEMPDYAVVNNKPIPSDFLARYKESGSAPLYLSKEEEQYLEKNDCSVVYADLVDIRDGRYLRHNAQNLAEILSRMSEDVKG